MAEKKTYPLLKMKNIKNLRAAVTAQFGEKTIVLGHELEELERIPTGIPLLDWITGGGIPYSRVTMLRGEPSSCKSLLSSLVCAQAQKADEFVVWCDVEGSFSQEWQHQLGMNIDSTSVIRPDNSEQAMDVLQSAVRVMDRGVVVLDSIAEMAPSADLKASYSEMSVGLAARLTNKFWRGLSASMNTAVKSGRPPAFIAINQPRIDVNGGNAKFTKYTYPGGEGQKYAASITLDTRKLRPLYYLPGKGVTDDFKASKEKDAEVIGGIFQVYAEKNKTAVPYRRGEFWIYLVHYEDPKTGFKCRPGQTNKGMQILALCQRRGIIEARGSWYYFNGERLGQGAANVGALIEDNPKLGDALMRAFWELEENLVTGGNGYEPPPPEEEDAEEEPPKKSKKKSKKGDK